MTYIELINRCDNFLKARDLNKNIILQIIYSVVPEIKSLTDLTSYINDDIPEEYLQKILDAFEGFLSGKRPLVYFTGKTFFCNNEFIVNDHVLPPRPETEEWTKMVIDIIKDYGSLDVLDLCCGTGVIGLSIKKHLPYMKVTLSDISKLAFVNTDQNAKALNLDVNIVLGNLFENLKNKKFDVILFNPPYVDTECDLKNYVTTNEPYNAIFAPKRGMWFYETILENIKKYLKEHYLVAMEIGFNLAGNVGNLIRKYLNCNYEVLTDSNGIDRVIIINNLEKID